MKDIKQGESWKQKSSSSQFPFKLRLETDTKYAQKFEEDQNFAQKNMVIS